MLEHSSFHSYPTAVKQVGNQGAGILFSGHGGGNNCPQMQLSDVYWFEVMVRGELVDPKITAGKRFPYEPDIYVLLTDLLKVNQSEVFGLKTDERGNCLMYGRIVYHDAPEAAWQWHHKPFACRVRFPLCHFARAVDFVTEASLGRLIALYALKETPLLLLRLAGDWAKPKRSSKESLRPM
jgi:hypothetical protein